MGFGLINDDEGNKFFAIMGFKEEYHYLLILLFLISDKEKLELEEVIIKKKIIK